MIDVLRIAHLRIAPQEGNSEVGNCEVHQPTRIQTVIRTTIMVHSHGF